jgi:hypothetical protein
LKAQSRPLWCVKFSTYQYTTIAEGSFVLS